MFTFEIFTLDRKTKCHNVELHVSKQTYNQYDFALWDGITKSISLSTMIPNTLIELNIWDSERAEYVDEIVFENGNRID